MDILEIQEKKLEERIAACSRQIISKQEEIKPKDDEQRKKWEEDLAELYKELTQIQMELDEWNKPEEVELRKKTKIRVEKQEELDKIKQERLENDKDHNLEDLDNLIKYLKYAGMEDLANKLYLLRYANKKTNSDFIKREVELEKRKKEVISDTQTTKKEYRQIKSGIVKLSKNATRILKKYKDLRRLFSLSYDIIRDMKIKGILEKSGDELVDSVKDYFTQPMTALSVHDPKNPDNHIIRQSPNFGYECLKFYRDYNSKFNEDLRSHKM